MKPLFVNGAVYAEADALRAAPTLPPVPRFSTAALRCVGIEAEHETMIKATLFGYDRGNPLNTVAFCAVLARLHGSTSSDQLPTHVVELVRQVNLIGARAQGRAPQVSLPRNLARWPAMLVLYYAAMQPLHDSGSLLAAVDLRGRGRQTTRRCSQRSPGQHRPARCPYGGGVANFAGTADTARDGAHDSGGEPAASVAARWSWTPCRRLKRKS